MNRKLIVSILLMCLGTSLVWAQKKTEAKKLKPRSTPVLQLENGVLISKIGGVTRPSAQTVCAGDKISFAAGVTGADTSAPMQIQWTTAYRKKSELVKMEGIGVVDEAGKLVIDTTSLEVGTYVITAEAMAPYTDCEGGCTAYDSKTFVVTNCEPVPSCFTTPAVDLTTATKLINPGEVVSICAGTVTGGYKYGALVPSWTTSAGRISGDLACAKLDTTGIAPGSNVTVTYKVRASEFEQCEATGTLNFKVAEIVAPEIVNLSPCDSFKTNSSRVDNACKSVLFDAARQLEADPQARLVIDAYHRQGERASMSIERGKNVRDRLADGSIGIKVDANRLIVRPSGVATDDGVVRLMLIPAGAKMPAGAEAVNVGGVTTETRRPATKRNR